MPESSPEPQIEKYFTRALELAKEARGGVSPRPAVGAVIVKDGKIVGEGMTEPRPGIHAEVAAIRSAGAEARGATMYCTLEPHAHQGVAPPCTEEIIAAGIETLVCPIEDPNPEVNGNGFRSLKSAGVEVITDVSPGLRREAEEIVAGFRMLLTMGRPQFTLKYAVSLDGRIATHTGESQWITGEEARAEAHRLRRWSDALITGIGTVLADDPRLTARNSKDHPTGRPRLRVVMDTHGRMPADAALLNEPGDVLWIVGEDPIRRPIPKRSTGDLELVTVPAKRGHLDLALLAKLLGDRGCCDVLVEAGERLAGAFVEAGLVDRIAAFIGPVIVGGESAPGPVGGEGFARLADALRVDQLQTKALGEDILLTGRIVRPES